MLLNIKATKNINVEELFQDLFRDFNGVPTVNIDIVEKHGTWAESGWEVGLSDTGVETSLCTRDREYPTTGRYLHVTPNSTQASVNLHDRESNIATGGTSLVWSGLKYGTTSSDGTILGVNNFMWFYVEQGVLLALRQINTYTHRYGGLCILPKERVYTFEDESKYSGVAWSAGNLPAGWGYTFASFPSIVDVGILAKAIANNFQYFTYRNIPIQNIDNTTTYPPGTLGAIYTGGFSIYSDAQGTLPIQGNIPNDLRLKMQINSLPGQILGQTVSMMVDDVERDFFVFKMLKPGETSASTTQDSIVDSRAMFLYLPKW